MRRRPSRGLISIALVGAGSAWEARYREAVARLNYRMRVIAVYDPVPIRAAATAEELRCDVCPSLWSLLQREDIDGLLVCDLSWPGPRMLEMACLAGKPALVTDWNRIEVPRLRKVWQSAALTGVTLMAETAWRYMPASCRLRELMTTRLGPVRRVRLEMAHGSAESPLIEPPHALRFADEDDWLHWIDWCSFVIGRLPQTVERIPPAEFTNGDSPGDDWVRISYRGPQPQATSTIEMSLGQIWDGTGPFTIQVECERGSATIHSSTTLEWTGPDQLTNCEMLQSERSSPDVLVDQLCRRVVGAIIPVADLTDAIRVNQLASAIERCISSDEKQTLPREQF